MTEGRIGIVPQRFEKVYLNWMENIRDWCISRQLWWGHQIPVWYCENDHVTCQVEDPATAAPSAARPSRQDEDVLDTWFSLRASRRTPTSVGPTTPRTCATSTPRPTCRWATTSCSSGAPG